MSRYSGIYRVTVDDGTSGDNCFIGVGYTHCRCRLLGHTEAQEISRGPDIISTTGNHVF